MADLDGVGGVEGELGEGNPHFSRVLGLAHFFLVFFGEGMVDIGVARHAVDEDEGNFFGVDVERWDDGSLCLRHCESGESR